MKSPAAGAAIRAGVGASKSLDVGAAARVTVGDMGVPAGGAAVAAIVGVSELLAVGAAVGATLGAVELPAAGVVQPLLLEPLLEQMSEP